MPGLRVRLIILFWCFIFAVCSASDQAKAIDNTVFDALFVDCGGDIAPETLRAIIAVESGGNPYAIGVNQRPGQDKPDFTAPSNQKDAVTTAKSLIAAGYNIDMGLMQINSANLPGLKLIVDEIFDPCQNIKAGAKILLGAYDSALKKFTDGQECLKAALSAYNTGNHEQGLLNGYVAKYYGGAAPKKYKVPAIEFGKKVDISPVSPSTTWKNKDTVYDESMAVDLEMVIKKEQQAVLVNEDNPYTASLNAWPTSDPEKGDNTMSEEKKTVYPMTSNDLADLDEKGVIVTVNHEEAEQYSFEDESVPVEDVLDAVDD